VHLAQGNLKGHFLFLLSWRLPGVPPSAGTHAVAALVFMFLLYIKQENLSTGLIETDF
jgi:hypothetical protein